MSILKVARLGHPILRAKARKVDRREIKTPAVQALVDDMMVTLREYGSLGLTAPQVHHDLRLLVAFAPLDGAPAGADRAIALFNPELDILAEDLTEDWEGCASVPGIQGRVPRALNIAITATDREGNRIEFQARGLYARLLQHACDHLDGLLFVDRMRAMQSLAYVDQLSETGHLF